MCTRYISAEAGVATWSATGMSAAVIPGEAGGVFPNYLGPFIRAARESVS